MALLTYSLKLLVLSRVGLLTTVVPAASGECLCCIHLDWWCAGIISYQVWILSCGCFLDGFTVEYTGKKGLCTVGMGEGIRGTPLGSWKQKIQVV